MSMSIGETMRQARTFKGLRQEDAANALHVSKSSIGHYERNYVALPEEIQPQMVKFYDEGRLALKMAQTVTGGASTPYLDGPAIDHHTTSLIMKTLREVADVGDILPKLELCKPKAAMTKDERTQFKRAAKEIVEAKAALATLLVNICNEFGYSYVAITNEAHTDMVSKGMLESNKQ